jgi:phosphatidyl-myo-inositol alpha-mannosyltransferase
MTKGRKLKVGLVFDDSLDSNDGVAQYVRTLGAWLADQGYEVRYLVGETQMPNWRGGRVYSLAANLKVRFNGNRLSMPLLSRKAALKDVLAKEKFDILHVMAPYSPLMAQRLIMMAGPGTAVVGTFHILPSGWLSRAGSYALRAASVLSLRRFDGFISVSRPAQEFARRVYGIESSVVPNPVDLKKFRDAERPAKKKQIVFLGRLVERKGCRQLIKAFAEISEDYPKYQLIIAGDGPQRRQLEKLAQDLGVGQRTRFLGYIDEDDKPEILGSAAIACFPSLYGESFGIVLIEAMAAGSGAILAGDNPGYHSVLADQPQLLFNPREPSELAAKLARLLSDDAYRSKIRDWQDQEVQKYDIEVVGRQLAELYKRAIAKTTASRHN